MRRRTGQKHFKSLTIGRKGRGWGVEEIKLGAEGADNWRDFGGRYNR